MCYFKYFCKPQFLTVPKEGRESLVYMSLISTFGNQRQFQKKLLGNFKRLKLPLHSEFQDRQCYIERSCQKNKKIVERVVLQNEDERMKMILRRRKHNMKAKGRLWAKGQKSLEFVPLEAAFILDLNMHA